MRGQVDDGLERAHGPQVLAVFAEELSEEQRQLAVAVAHQPLADLARAFAVFGAACGELEVPQRLLRVAAVGEGLGQVQPGGEVVAVDRQLRARRANAAVVGLLRDPVEGLLRTGVSLLAYALLGLLQSEHGAVEVTGEGQRARQAVVHLGALGLGVQRAGEGACAGLGVALVEVGLAQRDQVLGTRRVAGHLQVLVGEGRRAQREVGPRQQPAKSRDVEGVGGDSVQRTDRKPGAIGLEEHVGAGRAELCVRAALNHLSREVDGDPIRRLEAREERQQRLGGPRAVAGARVLLDLLVQRLEARHLA